MLVDYTTIGDRQYPVSFNMYSLTYWAKECGIPLDDLFGGVNVDFDAYEGLVLMYSGLKFGAKETKRRFTMTESEFGIALAKDPELGPELMTIFGRHMEKLGAELGAVPSSDTPDDSQKKAQS